MHDEFNRARLQRILGPGKQFTIQGFYSRSNVIQTNLIRVWTLEIYATNSKYKMTACALASYSAGINDDHLMII